MSSTEDGYQRLTFEKILNDICLGDFAQREAIVDHAIAEGHTRQAHSHQHHKRCDLLFGAKCHQSTRGGAWGLGHTELSAITLQLPLVR